MRTATLIALGVYVLVSVVPGVVAGVAWAFSPPGQAAAKALQKFFS